MNFYELSCPQTNGFRIEAQIIMTVAFLQISLNLGGALGQDNGQQPNITIPLCFSVTMKSLETGHGKGTQRVGGKMSLYSSHIPNIHTL